MCDSKQPHWYFTFTNPAWVSVEALRDRWRQIEALDRAASLRKSLCQQHPLCVYINGCAKCLVPIFVDRTHLVLQNAFIHDKIMRHSNAFCPLNDPWIRITILGRHKIMSTLQYFVDKMLCIFQFILSTRKGLWHLAPQTYRALLLWRVQCKSKHSPAPKGSYGLDSAGLWLNHLRMDDGCSTPSVRNIYHLKTCLFQTIPKTCGCLISTLEIKDILYYARFYVNDKLTINYVFLFV